MRRFRTLPVSGLLLLLAAPQLGAQNTAQLAIGQNFTGSTYGIDSSSVPADSTGAAGPLHFVEFINGRYSVYSKTSGTRVQTMTDDQFWAAAGFSLPSGWALSDPRLVFDPSVQRWFAVQIDFDPSGRINTNAFLLAASASADPTGAWHAVLIPSDPGGNDFADFPTLGLDSQGIFLGGDMFDATGAPVGSTLVSIPKSGLLAPIPSAAALSWFGVMSYGSGGHILQPAMGVDGTAGAYVLGAGGLGFNFSTGQFENDTTLVVSVIQNPAGPGTATLRNPTIISVPGYTAPLNPTQPDGSNTLDDGDSRFSSSVRRVGAVLYAVHGTEVKNLAAVRWYRINATNLTLLETGTISDSNLDLFYPSVAANTNGTMVIACNGTSASTFVSSYAVVGQTVNGVTTFGTLTLLKSGIANYHVAGSTKTSRWGDYSATTVDPVDPTRFWTIQMVPSSATAWSTQITELLTSPAIIIPPSLTIASSGTNVLISWPANAGNFVLASTPTLSGSQIFWSQVTQSPATNGGIASVLLPASADQQYFRLTLAGPVFP